MNGLQLCLKMTLIGKEPCAPMLIAYRIFGKLGNHIQDDASSHETFRQLAEKVYTHFPSWGRSPCDGSWGNLEPLRFIHHFDEHAGEWAWRQNG